jgi:hypothetical protein
VRSFYLAIFAFTILLSYQSCDQTEICSDSLEANANVRFWIDVDGVLQDTVFEALVYKGIQTPDTISFDTLYNKNSILLPLPQESDSCIFVLSFAVFDSIEAETNNTAQDSIWDISYFVNDTLRLNFTRLMYLVSSDCGFAHLFEMQEIDYTTNMIQSAEIVNSEINELNEENIRLRF